MPGLLAASVALAEPDAPESDGWKELSLLNARASGDAFAAVPADSRDARAARLGGALALLQSRSRSPALIERAAAQLAALRREREDDDTGIAAAYYLARIEQVHRYVPDRAAAVAGFRALLAAHPGHYYAQLAAPKLAMLLLYDEVPDAEWQRRREEIEAVLPTLNEPGATRDTRLTLAMALIRVKHDYARAYPLLSATLNDGSVMRVNYRGALLVTAAECAHQLGKVSEETAWYERFVADFPRDAKTDEIRRRLARGLASSR